jgi:ATP/maltotriose-dependent transcriptional regulator MalT
VFLASLIPLLARIASAGEKLDVAEAAATRVLSLVRLNPALAMYARSGLAQIAVQRNDADSAAALYGSLESQRGTASFFIPLTVDRLLGLLAATFGRMDTALGHFEDGLAFCDRAGYRPEYAWTAADCADVLLRRAGADDQARATALQDDALGVARELGMESLTHRVLAGRA